MKLCTKCGITKPFTAFTKGPDKGYRYQCKECNNNYQLDAARRKENSSRYYNKRKQVNPSLFMWKQAKHRAKWDYGEMEFSISVDDIQIPPYCPYLGTEFIALDKQYGHSLDRVDSSKGYSKDNIQVISRLANIMKNNATKEQLIAFAKGVLVVHSKEAGCDADSV